RGMRRAFHEDHRLATSTGNRAIGQVKMSPIRAAVPDALRKQLKKLEEQEERLIDLAADGKVSSEKLRSRLEAVTLQKGALMERLSRTGQRIQSGADAVFAYVDLLENPRELYLTLPDTVRHSLLAAFFARLRVYVSGGELSVKAERTMVNTALHSWQEQHRLELSQAESAGECGCEHENRASRVSTGSPVVILYRLTQSKGLSKPVLVGLTGFEPATP
ncbi:hypothetical protein, partial [Brachybacterium paraconglomeratum]|uniref:hypothetical protein n=1 Tax=Brachybacterium paraconglomeratum TaxID=173362 RepID=UPI0022B046D3